VAGIIMRDFTDQHPEYFTADNVEASDVDEGIKSKLAAGALGAALALGGGGAKAQTVGHAVGAAVDTARVVQSLKNMGWAGAKEDLSQEIKNYSRALGGDANAQNQSWLYRQQQRQGTLPPQAQPQTDQQAQDEFDAYKKEYYRKKAEFDKRFQQNEGASGYIPTKKQARDPRFSMALTQDIRPGEVGRQANKMALKTDSQGRPGLLMKTANLREGMSLQERLEQELARLDKDNPYEYIDPRNKPAPANKFGMNGHVDEDYSPDEPPGPESKPTMPKGTLRVDVSDMYDWYKLGQHISNMKGLGKHDFGAGPPSSIVSFGDENTEHKFIGDIEATGLDVTDIDPADPVKRPGKPVKTDPTFNVDENFADGKIKGKSRPGRVKRAGASCDGSVADLRAKAKKYSGERAKMYHWCANMKAGRQDESKENQDLRTFHARVKLKGSSALIDTQVVARNYEMAKRLLRAQYGENSIVSNMREIK
jgi:hypothetical protein